MCCRMPDDHLYGLRLFAEELTDEIHATGTAIGYVFFTGSLSSAEWKTTQPSPDGLSLATYSLSILTKPLNMENRSIGIYNCYTSPQFLGKKFTNSLNAVDILTLTAFSAFKLDNLDTLLHCGQNYSEIENIFEAMEREFLNKETGYIQILHNYLDMLLTKFFECSKIIRISI